ncbi:tetratricopeptide repeat protein [Helicobacter sp. 11S02629-2]|uniref:tetratricopeptide repeat protein n=1 Tax=Helicobacter sp. 11S02629-2 TaxID=1476195 RepID=UPI000BA70F85|nr:tetratricopeptide repeat protein [Helicobacter sp. 11S02629-2]PAF45897.1 hypothetical protein BKH40_00345 [Helicobacter sp. 11S02629-2]
MQSIIELYRDPIFGIIILCAIVAVVAIADYSRLKLKRKNKKHSLENLSKKFEVSNINEGIKQFIKTTTNPKTTLLPIAKTYAKAGNHEQAISIYTTLLDNLNNTQDKIEVLEELGVSYYDAGFIQRAKGIFLEVLKNFPNNIQMLSYLMRSYEFMGQYQKALETLTCIEEIQSLDSTQKFFDIPKNKSYLEAMFVISHNKLSGDDKIDKLLKILSSDESVRSLVLRHFKTYNVHLFWQEMDKVKSTRNYIDILWDFKIEEVPFNYLNNEEVLDVYRAKGFISDEKEIELFALEALRVLHKHSHTKGSLEFSYRCSLCQGVMPFYSHRCPICGSVDTMVLKIVPIGIKPIVQGGF